MTPPSPDCSPPPRLEAALELRAAGLSFAHRPPVFSGLDVAIPSGSASAFVGPSGCGKSTLLRVFAGLQSLSAGECRRRVARPAFVFQEPALMPWASAEANVALPLRIGGMPAREAAARAREVLSVVGLQSFAQALPHELSGGMKMRTSIARALIMDPDLVLLDEPFSALDDPTRQRLQDDVMQWWRDRRFTLCLVTHQVAEAVVMSEQVVLMASGGRGLVERWSLTAPFPRGAAYRRSAAFHDAVVRISDALAASTHGGNG